MGLLRSPSISLDDISLVDGEMQADNISSYSGTLTKQDGQEMEDVSMYAERMEEDEDEISESEKISETVLPLDEEEGGTNLEDVSSDASVKMKGRESQVEAPIPVELSARWSPKEIPYHVLLSATNNFSEEMVLGKGGFGPVYRGFLSDLGLDVAIKKLSERSHQGMSEYMSEVNIITQLRHRNLVKLIGWCHENRELMLVYEFMPNGSLDNHLFKENLLEWPLRFKIVLGLANALMYLHHECDPYVLHRDVKSSNVLLDSKFDAKLADFGLARLFNLDVSSLGVTDPAGTRGYWAPEYALWCKASRSSDVYSYGVVALETACGKNAILMTQGDDVESNTPLLVEWVWQLYGKGTVLDAADKRLKSNFNLLQMERLLMVGLWCAQPDPRKRPTMRQASSALLFSETMSLPDLPTEVVPWAYPLASMQMHMAQLSPMPASSPTWTSSISDESTSSPSQNEKPGDRDLDTSSKPTASKSSKRRLFPQLTWWLKGRRSTSFDESLGDNRERIRMVNGVKELSYQELVQATDDFSADKVLVKEWFDVVYKGRLASGVDAAVKRFQGYGGSRQEFMAEVTTLSSLSHGNLVKLIGWCHELDQYLLVFEYMPNGTLFDHLFGDLGGSTMPWQVRYKVALNLASALCHLHNASDGGVLHGNIKAHTVFLDEECNMKLGGFGGFGIRRVTDHAISLTGTAVARALGYMAPESVRYGRYTTASDVYSFGIVALEIACGRKSSDLRTQWAWCCYANGNLLKAADEKLMGSFDSREMEQLLVIGLWCTYHDPARRPQMAKVLRVLLFQEEPPVPANPEDAIAVIAPHGALQFQMPLISMNPVECNPTISCHLSPTPSVSSACDSDIEVCLR